MKKIILVLVVALSLFSCKQEQTPVGNNFLFVKTQPINESELSKIPNKFLGNYTNSDSTKLSFTENAIFKETTDKFRFHKRDLDSLKKDFDVIKGKYILKNSKEVFETKTIGDSIELYNKKTDTIFKFTSSWCNTIVSRI